MDSAVDTFCRSPSFQFSCSQSSLSSGYPALRTSSLLSTDVLDLAHRSFSNVLLEGGLSMYPLIALLMNESDRSVSRENSRTERTPFMVRRISANPSLSNPPGIGSGKSVYRISWAPGAFFTPVSADTTALASIVVLLVEVGHIGRKGGRLLPLIPSGQFILLLCITLS